MNPATGHFASTTAIASAMKAQLQTVKLPDNTAAFQRVELFDSENLVEAFAMLLMSEQRIAIVVPLTARWEAESQQRKLLSRRVQPIAVLVSDRVIGTRQVALYGNDKNQGAFALAALAVPFLTGQLLPNPAGVISLPTSESVLNLKREDKQNLPGRSAVVLEFDCKGGWIEAPLGIGPTL